MFFELLFNSWLTRFLGAFERCLPKSNLYMDYHLSYHSSLRVSQKKNGRGIFFMKNERSIIIVDRSAEFAD